MSISCPPELKGMVRGDFLEARICMQAEFLGSRLEGRERKQSNQNLALCDITEASADSVRVLGLEEKGRVQRYP